jgi:hypothetical protein
MGLSKVEIKELQKKFNSLKREAKPIIDDLYRTECPKCHYANAKVTHTIWNEEFPQEVWWTCPQCQTRKGVKAGSEEDLKAALSPTEPPHWYPATKLLENSRINAKAGMNVSDLFTKRALVALSLLLFSIRQIENKNIRRVLEFCFNGALGQASKMVFVIRRRGKTERKAQVGSWVIGYWVPAEHFEINVWQCFENRFRRIVKGKQEVNAVISPEIVRCANFDELSQIQEGYWVGIGNATSLAIAAESIDYALIDPPHGNRIPYLELSLMWNAWLGFKSDWENEIVISQAKERQKYIKDYQNRLTAALSELWRVLKPNKYATIIFNSLNDKTWLSLLNAILAAGFEVREIEPLAYSARSVVQDTRQNALKTDFVITCQKVVPHKKRRVEFKKSSLELEHQILGYLADCVAGAETYSIINHIFVTNIPKGNVFKTSQIIKLLEAKFNLIEGHWYLNSSLEKL